MAPTDQGTDMFLSCPGQLKNVSGQRRKVGRSLNLGVGGRRRPVGLLMEGDGDGVRETSLESQLNIPVAEY